MRHLGIRHIHLAVRDMERSLRFYTRAFDMKLLHRKDDLAFLQTSGASDCLTLRHSADAAIGEGGGIDHFGLPLADPAELDAAIEAVIAAGGVLLHKQLEGGLVTAFVADPDGYKIQI